MAKTYEQLKESLYGKKAIFTFGRMNPPTKGHELLVKRVVGAAQTYGATPFIFVSQSQDNRKNPLSWADKVKYLSLGVPEAAKYIDKGGKVRTPFDAIERLAKLGFTDVVMVVGSDRVAEFKNTIGRYLNHPDASKSLPISKFEVISAGDRDPDADDVTGLSASKMRKAVSNNDLKTFLTGIPSHLSVKFGTEMFKKIQAVTEDVQPIKGLGYTRDEMPQIASPNIEEFVHSLVAKGIKVVFKEVTAAELHPTQNEIDTDKVDANQHRILAGTFDIYPFIASNDYRIIDRHHQLFALKNHSLSSKVPLYHVDLAIEDLLSHAHDFSKVFYKDIDGKQVK